MIKFLSVCLACSEETLLQFLKFLAYPKLCRFGWRFYWTLSSAATKKVQHHHSIKRFQGPPTLIMRSEHGSTLWPLTGEAGDMGLGAQAPLPLLSPHPGRLGRDPLPPSTGHTPPPRKQLIWDQPRWKPHFGLQIWIRGHISDTRWL